MIVDNELHGNGAVKVDDGSENFAHYITVPIFTRIEQSIRKNLANIGDSDWMTDETTGRSITYTELLEIVDRTAVSLRKRSIGKVNEPVLIVADNDTRLAVFIFALWKVGGYFGAILFTNSNEMLRSKIVNTGAKFILANESKAEEICQSVGDICTVIVIGQTQTKGCIPIDELLEDVNLEKTRNLVGSNTNIDLDAPVFMPFSSGTTGEPKGILHTHRSLSHIFLMEFARTTYNTKPDIGRKTFLINRLIHSSGLIFMIRGMLEHQHFFILSEILPKSKQSYQSALKGIYKIKPSWVTLYPHFVAEICNCSESGLSQYDLNSVETVCITGCPASPSNELEIFNKIPNLVHLENIYGMSETGIISQVPKGTRKSDHLVWTVGKAFPFVKIKIVDMDNNEKKLGPNQIGEVAVKTPFLMKQYVNLPGEMEKSMRDGWFFTGDLGSYDSEGHLFITGRIKELIKYRALHVQPTDIEKVLMTHPAVADSAVVGIPNEIDGEHPMAFIVLKENAITTPNELLQFTQKSLSEIEQLRGGIRFIDCIPRNPSGKIMRQDLIKMI